MSDRELPEPILEVLSSRLRLRILYILARVGEINVTALTRMLKTNYRVVEQQLKILAELGLIEDRRFGKIRLIRLRRDSELVQALVEFFDKITKTSPQAHHALSRDSA